MAQYEINLRDYLRILRKRKYIVLASTLTIGLLSFLIAYMEKPEPKYQSVASVKIEQSGTLTGLYIETVSWTSEDYLATQAEIIRSFPIMEKVAQKLGYVDSNLAPEAIRNNPRYVNTVLDLQSRISTKQQGMTNIIDIASVTGHPDSSKKLANTVAETYIAESTAELNKRATNALRFIEDQLDKVSQHLREAEEAVRNYREKTNLITMEYEAETLLNELKAAEAQRNRYRREREELQLLLRQIRDDQTLPEAVLANFSISEEFSSLADLKRQLTSLKLERQEKFRVFTEKHPAIEEIDEKIERVKLSIVEELQALEEAYLHKEAMQEEEVERLRSQYHSLPQRGMELARLQRRVSVNDEVFSFLAAKRQEALIQNAEKIEEAKLVRPALRGNRVNPPTPVHSFFVVGTLIGFILGMVFAFVYESLDTSIGTIEDVEHYLELPVIGVVPFIDTQAIVEKLKREHSLKDVRERVLNLNAHLISHFAPKSSIAESYRAMRTYLQYQLAEKEIKSFMITSTSPGEGKSTTAVNLAMTLAQVGKKTLLVDADLRKPKIATVFGLERESGLSNIILGTSPWRDTIRTVTDIMMGKLGLKNIIMTPGIDNLHIITSGSVPLNPSELLNSNSFSDFIREVEGEYEVVILDTTPVLPASDAVILARKVQGVIMVYQVGKVARGALKRAKTQLESVKAEVLGVVLNRLRAEVSPDYHELRYGDYYGYGELSSIAGSSESWVDRLGTLFKSFTSPKSKQTTDEWSESS